MSVCLLVLEPQAIAASHLLIPIASEDFYKRVWLLGAADTGAFWLPMFESGSDVAGADFPELCSELAQLKSWAVAAHIDPRDRSLLLTRIDLFVDGLKKLAHETGGNVKVFIG